MLGHLLTALLAGRSLDQAVKCAVQNDISSNIKRAGALDFNAWLPMAVQTGLLLGAQLMETPAAG